MEENNFVQSDENASDNTLTINGVATSYLRETAQWATFLSIVGFVATGLIVIVGIFIGSFMKMIMPGGEFGQMPGGMGIFMSLIYVGMGVLYFFPSWYLFKYSQKLKLALNSRDSNEITNAFENQKSLYKFWGIFTIVILSFYSLAIAFTLMVSLFR